MAESGKIMNQSKRMSIVTNMSDSIMNKPNYDWQAFDSQAALADSLADQIVLQIEKAIQQRGQAIVALSGGSTPKPLFEQLSTRDIDWAKVVITLVDERWVPIGHALSNADFLLEHLLHKVPAFPKFVPLFTISAAALSAQTSLISVLSDYCQQTGSTHSMPAAFDVVILGMGADGHTASFFPDADNIEQLVDLENPNHLLTCNSPSTQVDRVTWSLPALLNTQLLALHITGNEKKQVFETALSDSDACKLPIRSMLFQDKTELQVFYAD